MLTKEQEQQKYGLLIEKHRIKKGLSVEEIAHLSDISVQQIFRIRKGKHLPRKQNRQVLDEILEIKEEDYVQAEIDYLRTQPSKKEAAGLLDNLRYGKMHGKRIARSLRQSDLFSQLVSEAMLQAIKNEGNVSDLSRDLNLLARLQQQADFTFDTELCEIILRKRKESGK